MKEAVFNSIAQLAGWSESHTGGPKLTLWLPDGAALEPFKSMTARKGNTAGQLFAVCIVPVDDNGRPMMTPEAGTAVSTGEAPAPEDRPAGGPLARLAGQWCEAPGFRRWLIDSGLCPARMVRDDDISPTIAADAIRAHCGVMSRAELDHNPEAAARFNKLIRIPYMKHLGGE